MLRGRRFHCQQEWAESADGSSRLVLRLSSLEEIAGWVMGKCEHAVAIRPEALREQIIRGLKKGLSAYLEARAE